MKFIYPVPITETAYLNEDAGALTASNTSETVYPVWVSGASYKEAQRYDVGGTIYECIADHSNRSTSPATDARFWKLAVGGLTLAAWNAGTNYANDDRVSYSVTHRLYKHIGGGGVNSTPPHLNPTHWKDIGPTNSWAMFDQAVGTRTARATPLTSTIAPGIVDSIAFLDVRGASSVRVLMNVSGSPVYDVTMPVGDISTIIDWWDYFFGDFVFLTDFVLNDLPPYTNGTIDITVTGATNVSVGACVVGKATDIGNTQYGVGSGIIDYSVKETDDFGNFNVVERPFSKRIDVNLEIKNTAIDYVFRKLSDVRARPCVYFDQSNFQAFILYGFYKDWTINVEFPEDSDVTLSLEGLSQ